jgi:tetratricopeptide (TPR) repeat protein
MTTATPPRSARPPIKGSWEDLHNQAQQHARNFNDEAIPLYQRVFNGLMALPPAARAAGDNRLYNLMMTAGVELQGYFNLKDRYDEALDVIDKMLTVVSEVDKPQIIELKSDVLLLAGRGEEAVSLLRELIASEDADPGDWGQLAAAYIRMGEPEKALAAIDEMDPWVEAKIADGTIAGEEVAETGNYQQRLRIVALMELGRLDEAITLFNEVHERAGSEAVSPHMIYTRLIQEGQYREALRYIDRDQSRRVRAAFWRGLTYRYMGEDARARRIWQDALEPEFVRGDMESMVEHILTLYYLGDPKGEGLEVMLRTQREQTRLSWLIFMLTGIGWLIRGDERAAHSNFRIGISQIKSMGDAKTFANQYWRFVQDLVPADVAERFALYFETTDERKQGGVNAEGSEPTSAGETSSDEAASATEASESSESGSEE